MSDEGIIIKAEPAEVEYDREDNLQHDQLMNHQTTFVQNGYVKQETSHKPGISGAFPTTYVDQGQRSAVNTNFSCLLCDVVCGNRDELRRHLKTGHKSKSNLFSEPPGHHLDNYSSYLLFRYSCNVCGAKFKTFKNYFSHSMSHKGYGNLQSPLNDAMLRSGKEVLQNYFDAEDGLPGTFRCEECKTVFMQRDSYAMHMMMRAMNETCFSNMSNESSSLPKTDSDEQEELTRGNEDDVTNARDEKLLDGEVSDVASVESQKCLEDVTCKVDQDEYLKSVLDRVVMQTGSHEICPDLKYNASCKPCIFCAQSFSDQDSLAMHVMSTHADQMFGGNSTRNSVMHKPRDNIKWMTPYLYPLDCKYCGKKFVSRDNLAMHMLTHTQEEAADTSRDVNINLLKRKLDQVAMTDESSLATRAKITKRFENASNLCDKQILSASDFYCSLCSVQFYSKGDFEWHLRCRHSVLESKTEPHSLSKLDKSENSSNVIIETSKAKALTRRNSFSVDEQSRHHYVTPERPISADSFVKTKTLTPSDYIPEACLLKSGEKNPEKHKNLKIKKEIQRSMAIACVDALSSNEKRIIYSVFGNDLLKDKEPNGMKLPVEKVITLESEQKNEKLVPQQNITENFNQESRDTQIPKTSPNSAAELKEDLNEVLKGKDAAMCRYCEIIFLNKAIYYLHMGLHNVNNHWQCNVCGKICKNSVDFAAHIIHM